MVKRKRRPSRQTALQRTLREMIQEGHFRAAVLASIDGLPLATVGRSADKELMAGTQGNCFVSRYFNVGDDPLLLAVKIPPGRPHRRLTNKAIREIQRVWET